MPALFLSYRRSDSPDTVKLLHERLKKRLPRWDIFYDHDSIPLGEQFPERLRVKVASATVVLVIIGPKWLEILHERKDAAIDHVRAEVRLALETTGNRGAGPGRPRCDAGGQRSRRLRRLAASSQAQWLSGASRSRFRQ